MAGRVLRASRRARTRDREAARDRVAAGRRRPRGAPDPERRVRSRRCRRQPAPVDRLSRGARLPRDAHRARRTAVAPTWPDGLHVVAFDPDRDAAAFHAAQQEAFADHWEYTPRDLESWSKTHLLSERFDPALWCLVKAGDDVAAGTICTADTYGGGFVQILFTCRPWRKQGIGRALLADAFRRLWERGERSVGLGVDAESETGAFRLYERAGMTPALGWVMYEKELRAETWPSGRGARRLAPGPGGSAAHGCSRAAARVLDLLFEAVGLLAELLHLLPEPL